MANKDVYNIQKVFFFWGGATFMKHPVKLSGTETGLTNKMS